MADADNCDRRGGFLEDRAIVALPETKLRAALQAGDVAGAGKLILRRRTRNFTIVANEVFNDERLSLEAMGLLAWLRSRPDDWSLSVEHLKARFKVGRDSMHRLVRELVEAGWVTRERKRDETTKAFIGIEYVVLDEAVPPSSGVSDEKPCPENQDVAQGSEVPSHVLICRVLQIRTTI